MAFIKARLNQVAKYINTIVHFSNQVSKYRMQEYLHAYSL